MGTPRHDIATAIATECAVLFEHGAELIVDGDVSPYEFEWLGPQTFRIRTQNRNFRVHVRSER